MPRSVLRFDNVSFAYDSSSSPLLTSARVTFPVGWSGIVGPNGSGKSTLLQLALRHLAPSSGSILGPSEGLLCDQRTDSAPETLDQFLHAEDSLACAVRGRLQLAPDWIARWPSLSHGERKRAQLAVALWHSPPLLALDEPTNHLDSLAKDLILGALRAYDGIGLLVSHDRDLLDQLCLQCVFLDPPSLTARPASANGTGAYTDGIEQARLEAESLRRSREKARRDLCALHQEANQRRDQALKAERQRSKKHVDKHDHDTKARINLLRVTDSGSGQRLRQLDGRLDLAQARLRDLPIVKDANLGVTILGERSPGKHLIALEPTSLPLGQSRHLELPSLLVLPVDRIALVGANGTGKSTLVRHILSSIQLPAGRIAYLPQEIALDQSRTILNNFRRLPKNELGRAMTIVDRLGSSPQRLLQSDCPSPGELRKLLLASCMVTSPFLIILDEPTNHLDLPSIECLENALDDCEAALILVSHDRRFLKRLARTTWEIQSQSNGTRLVVLG